jgi:RHS repeat-associated protein
VLPSIGSIFGSSVSNNVYFSGRLIKQGTDLLSGGGDLGVDTNFVAVDRLGSVKATYGGSGSAYMPYGEEVNLTSNDRMKFATYTRDASTGLDYADQRFYTSQFGRFMSADRFQRAAKVTDSGSWNKYSYTRGDPVNRRDRRGTCDTDITSLDFDAGSGGDTGCDDNSGGGDDGVAATCAANNLVYDPNSDSCVEPAEGSGGNTDPCPGIAQSIKDTISGVGMPGGKSLLTRVVQNITGSSAGYDGHDKQIQGIRNRLINLKGQWKDDDCDDPDNPPGGVNTWIKETNPKTLRKYHDDYQQLLQDLTKIGTAGAVAGGYLILQAEQLLQAIEGFVGSLPAIPIP